MLFGFGRNTNSALGNGNREHQAGLCFIKEMDGIVAIASGSDHTLLLTREGEVYVCGTNFENQLGTGNFVNHDKFHLLVKDASICHIACGGEFSFIYKNNGELLSFGRTHLFLFRFFRVYISQEEITKESAGLEVPRSYEFLLWCLVIPESRR